MTQRTTPHALVERNHAASILVRNEVADVGRRYGWEGRRGESWLPYHNGTHTQEVHDAAYRMAQRLASEGRIAATDVPLVRIAAAFHDHEQDLGPEANERASAAAALKAMDEHPGLFDAGDRAKVETMIMGTVVRFDSAGNMLQEAATENLLQAIIADADLASLGSKKGPLRALQLLTEFEWRAGRMELPSDARQLGLVAPDRQQLIGFLNEKQERLLGNHRYLIDFNEAEMGPVRRQNLERSRSLVVMARAGASFGTMLSTTFEMSTATKGLDGRGIR